MSGKDDRPVVALYYHPRPRSPSSTDLYKYMRDNSKQFRTILMTDTANGMTLEREMEKRNNGKAPDIVMDGFGAWTGLLESNDYIQKNDVKVVRTVGDVEVHSGTFFTGAGHHRHNTEVFCDALFFPVSPTTPAVERLKYYTEDLLTQMDSKFICIPFGVDIEKHKPAVNKDIDVLACYVADVGNHFQDGRIKMKKALGEWGTYINKCGEQYNGMKGQEGHEEQPYWPMLKRMFEGCWDHHMDFRIGPNFYEKYADMCNRSKIALADTSGRNYMTNKYLEFGASECCVIGEVPIGYEDLLNDDTMIGLDMEDVELSLTKELDHFFFDEEGRKEAGTKARKLRNLIKKDYTIERTCEKVEKALMELLK